MASGTAAGLREGMRRARYRVRQFGRGLRATLRPAVTAAEVELARSRLPAAAFSLFAALPADAQRHSLNVLQSIAEQGPVPDDLAAAALLHDVGKLEAARAGVALGLWARGPLVLAKRFAPNRLQRAARANPAAGWRYAVWVQLHHPAIGAKWAQEAGCAPRTVWLIANHADTPSEPPADPSWLDDLARLQRADDSN